MARNKISKTWLNEHIRDPYVHKAQQEGYRARAAYKLIEINKTDKLIQPGAVLADLGSAPGSWSQVASQLVGAAGKVFALDKLPMDPIPGVDFIQGDFKEGTILRQFVACLAGHTLDLVISDMAPNITGIKDIDQAQSFLLCELALEFASQYLKPGGSLIVKVFQGSGFQPYLKTMEQLFKGVVTRKPKASRGRSSEIYLLGKNRR